MSNLGVCKATISEDGLIVPKEVLLIQPPKADTQTKKQVRKNSDDLRRFRWLHDELHKVIKDCHIVTVEMPVGSQSARAMASYGGCVGVLASVSKPMIEVTPIEVKMAGAGIKTATKQEMIEWALAAHPEVNWKTRKLKGKSVITNDNEHLADALATIYAAVKTEQFRLAISMMRGMSNVA
ncbi:MAG: hypothetical protein ACXWT0_03795 [Methylobacter sp.]